MTSSMNFLAGALTSSSIIHLSNGGNDEWTFAIIASIGLIIIGAVIDYNKT